MWKRKRSLGHKCREALSAHQSDCLRYHSDNQNSVCVGVPKPHLAHPNRSMRSVVTGLIQYLRVESSSQVKKYLRTGRIEVDIRQSEAENIFCTALPPGERPAFLDSCFGEGGFLPLSRKGVWLVATIIKASWQCRAMSGRRASLLKPIIADFGEVRNIFCKYLFFTHPCSKEVLRKRK